MSDLLSSPLLRDGRRVGFCSFFFRFLAAFGFAFFGVSSTEASPTCRCRKGAGELPIHTSIETGRTNLVL
jgi:hypothetical protein